MIELRWFDGVLHYRERGFQVDASGAFCGVTEWSDWKRVPHDEDIEPIVGPNIPKTLPVSEEQ